MILRTSVLTVLLLAGMNSARADALYKGGGLGYGADGQNPGQQQKAAKGVKQKEPMKVVIPEPESGNPQCESGGQECAESALQAEGKKDEPSGN